jgi:uncharacterized protein YqhQ
MKSQVKYQSLRSCLLKESLPNYGGQALIEGVMMRGQNVCAIATRAPDQSILVKQQQLGQIYRSWFAKIPFFRGLLILGDALVLGMQALTFSANVQADEDEKIEGTPMVITMLLSLSIGIALFFLLPTGIAYLFEIVFGLDGLGISIVEGSVRLMLLIGYIWGIGLMPEIRRVYGYHGAEHKTINAFEAGASMDVESVSRYSREHPRCGTAFLLTVVVFSIIIFSLLGPMPIHLRLLTRILLVPILAMISYEYLRFTARFSNQSWIRAIIAPNLALQRLTTREPDEGMLEVAIAAFQAMREEEFSSTNTVS